MRVICVILFTIGYFHYTKGLATLGCGGSTCGVNARCTLDHKGEGRPVCSCNPKHIGDPLFQCTPVECVDNDDCPDHLTCGVNNKCVNPCESACGYGATCDVSHHLPVCSCPPRFTGNPSSRCSPVIPPDPCSPNPCGINAECSNRNGAPLCKCLPDYYGSPLTGCRRECSSDPECGPTQNCLNFHCKNACDQCGKGAICQNVANHRPLCVCPENYKGNPFEICLPECTSHSECPGHKPACYYNKCQNPCEGSCGIGANCELRGLTPVCSCPRDMTGDPFVQCRPFEKRDLCDPNPCGANARCQPGYDRSGQDRPVCTCLPGYLGNGVTGCIRGECEVDEQCADNRACNNNQCTDPCIGECGLNAQCSARRHIAVCTCPPDSTGDSLKHCYTKTRSINYGRSYSNYDRYGRYYNYGKK